MHWLDASIILLYLVGTAAVPIALARRQRKKSDFMLAGKKLHWFPLSLAEVAAGFSAISLLGAPGFVMANDLRYAPSLILGLPTIPIIYYFIVPRVYKLQLVSVYAFLETRFCHAFRYVAVALFITGKLGYLAMAIYTPALALATVTGLPVAFYIAILGLVTAALTMVGGMEGVVWQDVVQYFVIVGGIVAVVLYFCLGGGGGNVGGYWRTAAAAGKTRMLDFSFRLDALSVWVLFVNAMLLGIAGTCSDQTTVQRWSSARSLGDAMKSTVAGYVFGVPVVLVLYLIGICLYGFSQSHPLPPEIAAEADRAFPYFAATYLPRGACGLLLAGVLAAGMSTISAVLHSLTSLFMVDVWEKLRPDAAQGRNYVLVSRIVTVLWGLLAVVAAIYVMKLGNSIIEVSGIVTSFMSAPLGGVFMLGMFTKRANTAGTLVGVVCGVAVAVACWALNKTGALGINFMWFSVFSLLATCVAGYLASLLFAAISHHTQKEN